MLFHYSLARFARNPARALVALLVVGSVASAQTVTLHGEVEDAGGKFIMSSTPLTLVSGGANLQAVLGLNVEATGTVIGPNLFSVETVVADPNEFEIDNDVSVGGPIKFEVTGPSGQLVQIYVAVNDAFFVVKKQGLFLDTASLFFLVQGTITGGDFEITFTVPNDPALAGITVFGQVVRLQGGGGFELGNPDSVTIQP